MTGVVIGMDPHRRSVTIEVMGPDEAVLDGGRFATDGPGYAAMLRHAQRWPDRVWAIEGCNGIGRHLRAGARHDQALPGAARCLRRERLPPVVIWPRPLSITAAAPGPHSRAARWTSQAKVLMSG